MLDEIREQPAALDRTLRGGLRGAAKLAHVVAKRRPKLILLAARGTTLGEMVLDPGDFVVTGAKTIQVEVKP